jgi:hypothetical protein
MTTQQELFWLVAGIAAWFAIHMVMPRVAGIILAIIVVGALVIAAPQLAKLSVPKKTGG